MKRDEEPKIPFHWKLLLFIALSHWGWFQTPTKRYLTTAQA